MDFSHPYLTKQLIAYIGNKRKLLPLVYTAIKQTGLPINSSTSFLDAFAGSGSVSRLAKYLGLKLFCNDWEEYSYILNKGFIELNKSELKNLFKSEEDFLLLINKINSLPYPEQKEQYIAKYYAPKESNIDKVDFKTERLFYTKENALTIDKIRNYIEKKFPKNKDENTTKKRHLLLAQLLYQAATHTNTSGVFKAYHKGFGGHSKDALNRILKQIELGKSELIDSDAKVCVFKEDINVLVRKKELQNIDIAYLDPPYNQHQYGSNYHLLNTIALWDCLPKPLELNAKGELKEKAAIRHDWTKTKSAYCYSQEATVAFKDLIQNLNAKFILVSYSTDGIIPFETMRDICMQKGKISIVTNEYTKYRGGKQSNKRQNTNIEFILCIDTQKKSSKQSAKEIDSLLAKKKILLLFKQKFIESKLKEVATINNNEEIIINAQNKKFTLKTNYLFEVEPPENYQELKLEELLSLYKKLSPCICQTKEDELFELLQKATCSNISKKLLKKIPPTLKKLASKKNKEKYYFWKQEIQKLEQTNKELYNLIKEELIAIDKIAHDRFTS